MINLITYIKESLETKPNGFTLLKPGFTKHKSEFSNILIDNGWKILDNWCGKLNKKQVELLYKQHSLQPWFKDLVNYMSSDDSEFFKCYKDCKDPIKDMESIKKQCRDVWSISDMENAVHSSDSLNRVSIEANICTM